MLWDKAGVGIDIGAYAIIHLIIGAKSGARCNFFFETIPSVIQALEHNIFLNRLDNVIVVRQVDLGNKIKDYLILYAPAGNFLP